MRHVGMLLPLVILVAALSVVTIVDESDSATVSAPTNAPAYDLEYNLNTYNTSFHYEGPMFGDFTVKWHSVGINESTGEEIVLHELQPAPSMSNGWTVFYDPDEVKLCKELYVTQIVSKDGEVKKLTYKVNIRDPLEHGEEYTVTFVDGYSGKQIGVDKISQGRFTPVGGDFVFLPETPTRAGYVFLGWFIGDDLNTIFDPKAAVTSNMNVFARWVKDSSGGGTADPSDPSVKLDFIALSGNIIKQYNVGDKLNTTGMAVLAYYTDGSKEEVTNSCVFSPDEFPKGGEVEVTVSYEGVSTSYTVMVYEYVPGEDMGPDDSNPEIPDENSSGSADVTNYLLVIVGVLLVATLVVIVMRGRN